MAKWNVIHWQEEKTPASKQRIIDSIISKASNGLTLAQRDGLEVIGVGISSGGRVNYKSGIIVDSTSLLPDWKEVHIKEAIEEYLDIPVASITMVIALRLRKKFLEKRNLSITSSRLL